MIYRQRSEPDYTKQAASRSDRTNGRETTHIPMSQGGQFGTNPASRACVVITTISPILHIPSFLPAPTPNVPPRVQTLHPLHYYLIQLRIRQTKPTVSLPHDVFHCFPIPIRVRGITRKANRFPTLTASSVTRPRITIAKSTDPNFHPDDYPMKLYIRSKFLLENCPARLMHKNAHSIRTRNGQQTYEYGLQPLSALV